jgi:hypothetical protein
MATPPNCCPEPPSLAFSFFSEIPKIFTGTWNLSAACVQVNA